MEIGRTLQESEQQHAGVPYAGRGLELAAAMLAVDELNALAGKEEYRLHYEEMPPRYEIDIDSWDYADGPIPEHYLPSLTACSIYIKKEADDDLSDFQELWRNKEGQAFDMLSEACGTPSSLGPMPFESAANLIRRYLEQSPATRDLRRELKKIVEEELTPIVRDRTDQPDPSVELLGRLGRLAGSYMEALETDEG